MYILFNCKCCINPCKLSGRRQGPATTKLFRAVTGTAICIITVGTCPVLPVMAPNLLVAADSVKLAHANDSCNPDACAAYTHCVMVVALIGNDGELRQGTV